ncbi:MAG: hypothetical protein ACK5Y2_06740 [Bdellovibrionales bacterium]
MSKRPLLPPPEREEMPIYDESIFYPSIERRKLGITDEDMESIVQFFRWHLEQRNRRLDLQRIIAIFKLRMKKLIHQKKSELARELEALKNFSK